MSCETLASGFRTAIEDWAENKSLVRCIISFCGKKQTKKNKTTTTTKNSQKKSLQYFCLCSAQSRILSVLFTHFLENKKPRLRAFRGPPLKALKHESFAMIWFDLMRSSMKRRLKTCDFPKRRQSEERLHDDCVSGRTTSSSATSWEGRCEGRVWSFPRTGRSAGVHFSQPQKRRYASGISMSLFGKRGSPLPDGAPLLGGRGQGGSPTSPPRGGAHWLTQP